MASDFLLLWSRLVLFSLPSQQQEDLASSGIPFEAAIYFEYGKRKKVIRPNSSQGLTYWRSFIPKILAIIYV